MSELTLCNHCTLNRIKERAEKQGKTVIVTSRNDVYVFPIEVTLDVQREEMKKQTSKYRVAWFMALTDRCVC